MNKGLSYIFVDAASLCYPFSKLSPELSSWIQPASHLPFPGKQSIWLWCTTSCISDAEYILARGGMHAGCVCELDFFIESSGWVRFLLSKPVIQLLL